MDLLPLISSPRPLIPGTSMGLPTVARRLHAGDRIAVVARELFPLARLEPRRVGTVARVEAVRPGLIGGSYLDAAGEVLVRVSPRRNGRRAAVTAVDPPDLSVPDEMVERVERALRAYMAARVESGDSGDIGVTISADPVAASHEVASHLRISWPEVQELLEAGSAAERLGRALLVLRRETGLLRSLLGGKGTT